MQQWVYTVGRQCGSGGRAIARQLADRLGIPFYDKELIELAARESGLSREYIREAEEKRTSSFLYNLYFSSQNLPLSDQVFMAEAKVIRQLADKGPCVIVGRCADYVLREREDCIHAFVHAPLEQRVRRARDRYGLGSDEEAGALVARKDKARSSYYNYFTTGRWGDARNYHLSVSSGRGEQAVIRAVLSYAGQEEGKDEQ